MSDLAIKVEKVSKQFRIGAVRSKFNYNTLRDVLADTALAPFKKLNKLMRGEAYGAAGLEELFWALQDVSFEINRGEIVGIIGRNGAGKSTLLKILSRIYEPTEGRVRIYGRVGTLLEVGTGFHPELTGRENTYLNGAILGMKRSEIDRKFDEIIDFAEVEKFIDTPVKHYSSGMYLRLAFAVAAHLEPEILIVDEVLAVGDARFQKKCLNKMQDVGNQGRTVLFVSHNMPAVTRLCDRTILLENGTVRKDGPSHEVVGVYLHTGHGTTAVREWRDDNAPGGEIARLRAVRIRKDDGQISQAIDIRRPVSLEMEYDVLRPDYILLPHFHLFNDEGSHIFSIHDVDPHWRRRRRPAGRYVSKTWIPGNLLSEGTLFVTASMITLEPMFPQFSEDEAVCFQVVDSQDGDSARGDWTGHMGGAVRPLLKWETQYNPA